MPQSTNLNITPYFEDFDPDKNFHKVLFRPGYPLQARELTTLQSILQDQVEKFGSSIYKDGAMVIPGQIGYDLYYNAILIEDEYFGINANDLVPNIIGQVITGNSSGIKAKVVNALTSDQSEKNAVTLYVKYITAGSDNSAGVFQDDEILISNGAFSIGNTVIQENTDFAKCISNDASHVGSAAKITNGIFFIKGFFVTVKEQEIILDQFGTTPSYKVGLRVLEEITTPEVDNSLNDPSQGYPNYSAPGSHRLSLKAVLTKKSLDDKSISDFIELLRLGEGGVQEIVNSSKAQIARTLEDTLARRTFDESGDYEVKPYIFTKDECLNTGVNNGIFSIIDETDDGNIPSKDLFEINVAPGKAYVRGYEIENLITQYVDVEKPRSTGEKNNLTIRTDARGVELLTTTELTKSLLDNAINGIVAIRDNSNVVTGYGFFKSYEEQARTIGATTYNVIRLANIELLSETATIQNDVKKINFGGNITYSNNNNTVSGGVDVTIENIFGTPQPYLFPVYGNTVVKSVTDTKVQDILTINTGAEVGSGNNISVSGRNYYSKTSSDYTIKVDGDADGTVRSLLTPDINNSGSLIGTISGAGITEGTGFTIIGPEKIDNPRINLVSLKKMRSLKLKNITNSGDPNFNKYNINDLEISLGTTRVKKIHAIYNVPSDAITIQEVLPKVTLTDGNDVFKLGEVFIGRQSGAKGRVVKQDGSNNSLYFTYVSESNFIPNEEIFGYESATVRNIGTIDNQGYPDIKSRYKLDSGERPQSFEYSTLTKVSSESVTVGVLYVIFDYFKDEISNGQFYTVNSYYDAEFDDIPSINIGGETLYCSDHIDWRINQADVYINSNTGGEITSPFTINPGEILDNTNPLSYGNTNYLTSSQYLLPTGTTDGDIEYYLARIDELYLDKNGRFILQKGVPSLYPVAPTDSLANAMKVLTVTMPPYLRSIDDIKFKRSTNKRYTMRDIGNLAERIENIEYYTQLSLLESETANLFIPDGNGNNRLKNGFLVDNFTSHAVGDSAHPNYKCSIDFSLGELRPQHYTTNSRLIFEETPTNYIKGDFLMLDYTDKVFIEQPYAAVVENVNPFAVVSWVGLMQVFPASDDWVDEERLPETLTEVEGDYAATVFALGVDRNTGFAPTEWGAWQTQWSSSSSSSSSRIERSPGGGPPIRQVTTSSSSTTTFQTRSGIRTRVQPRVDREVLGDRVVDIKYARWKRSRNISTTAFRLKPGIRVYPFLDGREINAYVTPKIIEIEMTNGSIQFLVGEDIAVTGNVNRKFRATLSAPNTGIDNLGKPYTINPYTNQPITATDEYSGQATFLNINISSMQQLDASERGGYVLEGDRIIGLTSGATATVTKKHLIADEKGNMRCSIYIPDPNDEANPRWKVGESIIRFTDSATNSLIPGIVDSSAEGSYTASGTTFTKQQDTLLVNNAEITRDTVSDSRTISSSSSSTRTGGWFDPLAQSFLVEEAGGCFVTKVGVYFNTKDTTLPVTMQIREMVNGYPSPVVLNTVNLDPSNVNVSSDASVETIFEFETPTYLSERREYCFAVLTSSVEYTVWLSEMGKDDLNGERISKQPYAGVLFKSQNASTWTTAEYQDMKFKIYRASFKNEESPTFKFIVDNSGLLQFSKLRRDPIELNVNNGRIKVHHKNHGLHDNSSYVEIVGVSSEQYTKLNAFFNGAAGSAIECTGNAGFFTSGDNINGAPATNDNPGYIKIKDCIYSYNPGAVSVNGNNFTITTIALISGTIPTDGFKVEDEWQIENYVYDGVPLTMINTIHTQLEWITLDSYQINLSGVQRNSLDNLTFGGDNVRASQNISYNDFLPLITYRELPGTTITAKVRGTSGTSIGTSAYSAQNSTTTPDQRSYIKDSNFIPVIINENNGYLTPKVLASSVNEQRQMIGTKSFELQITLTSEVENLSPFIDKDRISLVTTGNRVSDFNGSVDKEYFFNHSGVNYNPATSSKEDYNPANYITKLVSLENECTSIKINFAAFNNADTDIDVYVKLLTGDERNPEKVGWTEVPYSGTLIKNELTFADYEYQYDLTSGSFTKYQIKIRLRSRNQAIVPIVKDLRCIALA